MKNSNIITVSYTHLDVYKRQLLDLVSEPAAPGHLDAVDGSTGSREAGEVLVEQAIDLTIVDLSLIHI